MTPSTPYSPGAANDTRMKTAVEPVVAAGQRDSPESRKRAEKLLAREPDLWLFLQPRIHVHAKCHRLKPRRAAEKAARTTARHAVMNSAIDNGMTNVY